MIKFHSLGELELVEGTKPYCYGDIVSVDSLSGIAVELKCLFYSRSGVTYETYEAIFVEIDPGFDIPEASLANNGYGVSPEQDIRINDFLVDFFLHCKIVRFEYGVYAEQPNSISGPRGIRVVIEYFGKEHSADFWRQDRPYRHDEFEVLLGCFKWSPEVEEDIGFLRLVTKT